MQDLVNDANIYLTTAAAVSAAEDHLRGVAADTIEDSDPCHGSPPAPAPAEAVLGSLLRAGAPANSAVLPLFSLSESTGHGILAAEVLSTSKIILTHYDYQHHPGADAAAGIAWLEVGGAGADSWVASGVRLWARIRHGRGDDWSCAL